MKGLDDNDVVRERGRAALDPVGGAVPFQPAPKAKANGKAKREQEGGDGNGGAIAVRLVALVDPDDLLLDDRGDPYAHTLRDDHRELLRVRGRAFRAWIAGRLYEQEEKAPNGEALAAALNVIEAMARKGRRALLWNRVARGADGAIWIDLADPKWRAVRVTAAGWEVRSDPPPLFRRFSHQQPLPDPVAGGDARRLLPFLDLLDRSLLIRLDRIPSERRKEEADFWRDFDAVKPGILGGLLDALSGAMRARERLTFDRLPRLADFARWGAAAAEALGYGADTFIKAMFANVERQIEEVVEHDPVAHAILEFARDRREWTGSAAELYEELNKARGNKPAEQGWPKRAADLGKRLNILRSTLGDLGVKAEPGRDTDKGRRRTWTIACQA